MPMETVVRRWTLATWLVAGHGDDIEPIADAIRDLDADVVLLQSIREAEAERLAAWLAFSATWAMSHYPRGRLRGGAVGLAALTPHHAGHSVSAVLGDHRSTWSKHRRIVQQATVARHDHSSYEFIHAVAPENVFSPPHTTAPPVRVHPARIEGDPSEAVELPDGASVVSLAPHRPIEGEAPLLAVTFEMPWVQGDFPVM